ncbi:unnamed protein product, partial [Meganyctiphanes norvegica]
RAPGSRQWAELLEVLAYVVCGEEGEVTDDLFTKILTSRGVLEKLFQLINKDGDGFVSRQEIMDFIANLSHARPRTGFTKENLDWLEQLFRTALGHKQELSFDDFKKIVHSRNSFFAERVFQIFDLDNSGTVSLSEFLDAMHQFAGKSPNDKIKFLFKVYDLDGDGLIQQSELQKVIKACMEENGMKFSDDQIEDLTLAMFEDADAAHTGTITYDALKAQLEKHDGLLENLSISIDRWLVPPNIGITAETSWYRRLGTLKPYQMSLPYVKNNYVYLSFLLVFISVNLGLFISRAVEYGDSNGFVIIARACGQCLNFNCVFVLCCTLRGCITFLRSHGAGSFLPLDQHLYLHKMCGMLIFIYSVVHTLAHLCNLGIYVVPDPIINANNLTYSEWLFTEKPGVFGLKKGWAYPTGVILIIILTVMVVCSQKFVRKSGYFEVFYFTHLLYVFFWILCIIHGPSYWIWFIVPGILFLIERVTRFIRQKTGRGKTYIGSGVILPSKVIHLVVKRPSHFHFHPGDYVYVNIPTIAKYEWHPFTISSAPEQEDALWLHIRAVGEWTNRLYNYFESEQKRCERQKKASLAPNMHPMIITNGNSITVVVEDTGLNSQTTLAPPSPMVTIAEGNNSVAGTSGPGGKRGNKFGGFDNASFEPDTNGNTVENNALNLANGANGRQNKPLGPVKGQSTPNLMTDQKPNKPERKLGKSMSVPDFEKKLKKKENVLLKNIPRPVSEAQFNSAALKQAQSMDPHGDTIAIQDNKSVVKSFRYMRRKPTIIALDLPEISDIDEDSEDDYIIEDEYDEEEELTEVSVVPNPDDPADELQVKVVEVITPDDIRIPKGGEASLAVEEGRVRRRSANLAPGGPNDTAIPRKISRQEERRQRRKSRLEAENGCDLGKPLVILIDGPFGAPSSHIFRAQHAVLVATGIGVTPFASILQSIMHKYWKCKHTCPCCSHSWCTEVPKSVMNLRKVDFFWINRDQRSFEWFVNLLSQLEIEQAEQGGVMERFLDMHMYITSALQKTDMKAVGLQLALDLLHEKEKRDLITGLKTRTNAGRPNWDKVFKQLKNQQKGKVTVFYCGPPALGRTLRYKCDEYEFEFRKEIF